MDGGRWVDGVLICDVEITLDGSHLPNILRSTLHILDTHSHLCRSVVCPTVRVVLLIELGEGLACDDSLTLILFMYDECSFINNVYPFV